MIYDEGAMAGETRKGIYQWRERYLVICIGTQEKARPQEFKTQIGDKNTLEVYKHR